MAFRLQLRAPSIVSGRFATPLTRSLSVSARRVPSATKTYTAEPAKDPEPAKDQAYRGTDVPARWLTDVRERIGKCLAFGCSDEQTTRAHKILEDTTRNWKQLLVNSQGYLTHRVGQTHSAGLTQRVAWGDMDSFVCGPPFEYTASIIWRKV